MSDMEELRLTCEEVELLLQDYLDGYLLPIQQWDLEQHLKACPACRKELILLRKLEERLEDSIPVEVPPGLAASISSRLPMNYVGLPWAHHLVRAAGVGLAGVMALLLVALLVSFPHRRAGGGHEVELVFQNPEARMVSVAGDFNDWNLTSHPMARVQGGVWRLRVNLPPGVYQYNFYIDNERWADNPGSQALVSDGFGGHNALLFIEG